MRIETKQQQGYVTVGKHRKPITLTIEDTYHEDGRKDCRVIVPRLGTQAKHKTKTEGPVE